MKARAVIAEYLYILAGTCLAGVGCAYFIIPGHLAGGGVNGLGTIAYHLLHLDPGLVMLAINVPLILIGMKVFGWLYGVKSILGAVLLSLWISLFGFFSGYEPVVTCAEPMSTLLSAIFGGALLGSGIGLVMRSGSNTGGTDIVAQILHKYTPLPMGICSFLPDAIVILLGFGVFGLERGLFAIIQLYVSSKAIGFVVMSIGTHYAKSVYIFSEAHDRIGKEIIRQLHHGGTVFKGTGIFTQAERTLLLAIVPNQQIYQLMRLVHEIDPRAFVMVSEAYQVMGDGFIPMERIMGAHLLEGGKRKGTADGKAG